MPFVSLLCVRQELRLQSHCSGPRSCLARGDCLAVIWPARCTSLGCLCPACVIAAVTIINRLTEIQSTGLFRCYGHAPWYKLVTHLGSVSTLLTPPRASGPWWCKSRRHLHTPQCVTYTYKEPRAADLYKCHH